MSDPTPPLAPTTPAPEGPLVRATRWWHSGYDLIRRDPALWLGMAALYVLFALLLKRIPFLGNLMLVLITPIPIAGVWLTARALMGVTHVPASGPSWPERLRFYVGRPARALVEGLQREVHALPVIMISIITLGLVLVVRIVVPLLTQVAAALGINPIWFDMLLSLGLYTLLAMSLFFVVPLVIFNDRLVVPAIPESFRLCARHASALGIFAAPFLLPMIVIELAFSHSFIAPLGYLLVLTVGVVAIPFFLAGCFVCYRELMNLRPAA